MKHIRSVLSIPRGRQEKEKEPSETFLQNGSLLLEKLVAASNGRYGIPIRSFTAEEVTRATNNFVDHFREGMFSDMCRGSWEERPILVKKIIDTTAGHDDTISGIIKDIVTTVQMSHHRNVLKLLGCCLEFKYPVPVYESTGDECLLDFLLYSNTSRPLSWSGRLKIANEIASAILYLHSAFQTPIIYRILHPNNIIIDQFGVAKLFNFSFSISLPPGKLQVQDRVFGTPGFFDYEYARTGIVSQKTDVFSFGVLLLVLLTGDRAIHGYEEDDQVHIVDLVSDCIQRNEISCIVDPRINGTGETILDRQLHAFIDLALKCTRDNEENRPDMIDVAKELLDITRCVS